MDTERVKARWNLARMAGEDAVDGGNGWSPSKRAAVVRSWQDIPELLKEIDRLETELNLAVADQDVIGFPG